jgi:hypothetical protein
MRKTPEMNFLEEVFRNLEITLTSGQNNVLRLIDKPITPYK